MLMVEVLFKVLGCEANTSPDPQASKTPRTPLPSHSVPADSQEPCNLGGCVDQ